MERIYVTVRARPLSPEDAKSNQWRISGNTISFNNSTLNFDFDRIFGEDCKTKEVYEARTEEIVYAAVGGFNGTIFAYGQTNSGKTHTMRGSPSEPGVIPLAVRDIFKTIQEVPNREFLLRMSYMEIYNEEINDLLAPEHRRLQIHESLERGIFVAGLREEIVASPEQVLDLMEFGESHRHIGETNMNLHSSRSHTIFRMIIESRDKVEHEKPEDGCDAVRVSVLNLVDLAGSERAAKTGAEGVRLKEGSHINKSLMTLGTVIKKLSEGAESQGGHVPYRDSKLTRILQPALGGNANTAIICNITLAQIHADETKSSLQFASRALRVTNCAQVNEILTDAALLKRQKKEIEELRAKLQGSHSEHSEDDVLSLRNTLLQTELERERIALELEEEKRAQVERERRLREQDRKIKNLSSMVLNSNRDELRDLPKKDKRRDTWCPGKLTLELSKETSENDDQKVSGRKVRQERESGPLVPFEELGTESQSNGDITSVQKGDNGDNISDDCMLPDPCTLLKVTNRRKPPQKKKSISVPHNELPDLQSEYDDLFLRFETQRTMYDVQHDCLKRITTHKSASDNEAILLISQQKDRIKELEMEKSSSDRTSASIIDSLNRQSTMAMEKYEELLEELQKSKEDARLAFTEQSERYTESEENISNSMAELLLEVQQISEEVPSLRTFSEIFSSITGEVIQTHSDAVNQVSSFKCLMNDNAILLRSIFSDYGLLVNSLKNRIVELENEKLVLQHKFNDIEEKIQNAQNSQEALDVLSEQYDLEKSELISHIQILEQELHALSSSSLFKEKESLRKDLAKTRTKLEETESKHKNLMHEKTRLEGEKANAQREVKKLQGQKALLERDIGKRDSVVVSSRARGQENVMQLTMQEDYKKLELLAFEMETTIVSLEEELGAANQEIEEVAAKNDILSTEMEMLSDKLDVSNSELNVLQEEISDLRLRLEKSEGSHNELESQIKLLIEEKQELATQLTNALLDLEEEKAVWFAKERASVEAIKEQANAYNDEIASLSSELSKVRNEMLSSKKEYDVLEERMKCTEEHADLEKRCSMEKSSEIDELKCILEVSQSESMASEELLKSKLEAQSLGHNQACEEVKRLHIELASLSKEREAMLRKIKEQETRVNPCNCEMTEKQLQFITEERNRLMVQIQELQVHSVEGRRIGKDYDNELLGAQNEAQQLASRLSNLEWKMHDDGLKTNKDTTKLRMRLRCTQAKLDAFRERYKESLDEHDFMHTKFKEDSNKLKERLASCGIEVLNLKKQIATAKTQ